MKADVRALEIYCPNEKCGDAEHTLGGVIRRKRRMVFSRKGLGNKFTYVCPVCGFQKHFKRVLIGRGFREI